MTGISYRLWRKNMLVRRTLRAHHPLGDGTPHTITSIFMACLPVGIYPPPLHLPRRASLPLFNAYISSLYILQLPPSTRYAPLPPAHPPHLLPSACSAVSRRTAAIDGCNMAAAHNYHLLLENLFASYHGDARGCVPLVDAAKRIRGAAAAAPFTHAPAQLPAHRAEGRMPCLKWLPSPLSPFVPVPPSNLPFPHLWTII